VENVDEGNPGRASRDGDAQAPASEHRGGIHLLEERNLVRNPRRKLFCRQVSHCIECLAAEDDSQAGEFLLGKARLHPLQAKALALDQLLELPAVAGEDNVEVLPRRPGDFDHSSGFGQVVTSDCKYQCLHRVLEFLPSVNSTPA